MKFVYEYQDKTNKRHSGVLRASTRSAAYAILKQQGIKPIRCVEAPGLLNLVLGRGKRWIAIGCLALTVAVALVALHRERRSTQQFRQTQSILDLSVRRQLVGDAAVIEKGIRTGWSDVFELEGERFLASFAIPGVPAGQRSTTEGEIRVALSHDARTLGLKASAGMEARQIIAMVEGMKDELRLFLSAGGTIVEYGERLVARQNEELGYYNRAKQEIELMIKSGGAEQDVISLWEKRNSSLRKMGIKLVTLPEDFEGKDF